ncbi:MAG: hypothetical protein R3D84_17255 [Paracoccaceae bacterium]
MPFSHFAILIAVVLGAAALSLALWQMFGAPAAGLLLPILGVAALLARLRT